MRLKLKKKQEAAEKEATKNKVIREQVKEIHETFYTEVQRLEEQARKKEEEENWWQKDTSALIEHLKMYDEIHYAEDPLEIAAPKSDFNTDDMEFEGKKLVQSIPDPVVLQPVQYKLQKYYLIVTAWGDEASDPYVVNEKNN